MNPRLAALATLVREFALPGAVLVCIAASGFAGLGGSAAVPPIARAVMPEANAVTPVAHAVTPVALASANAVVTTQAIPQDAAVIADQPAKDMARAEAGLLAADQPAKDSAQIVPAPEPQPIVTASLPDSSEKVAPAVSQPDAAASPSGDGAGSANPQASASADCAASEAVSDSCTDGYLWTLYQRAPKQDSVSESERKAVQVKRKGKLVTVMRTVWRAFEQDFTWKDLKAAETVGMQLRDYVIGGMDRDFKLKLSRMLRAADEAGLQPGITSAFRDDFRQSIANGLKAATNRSYHGGSLRGGYGHGLAADIVSTNGATRAERLVATSVLWKWVDAHGKDFGIGRPYLGRDPPHVAPVDGNEWAVHRLHKPDMTPATPPTAQAAAAPAE